MTDFAALGFDPAPGQVDVVDGYVDTLTEACEGIDDATALLDGDDNTAWTGKAAAAFRAAMSEDFRPQLGTTSQALTKSRNALRTWSDQLAGHQHHARELAVAAEDALAKVSRCAEAHENAQADAGDDAEPDAVSTTATALSGAREELQQIRDEAVQLKNDVDDDATATARALEEAGGTLDDYSGNPFSNWLDDVGDALADVGEWLMDNLVPIVEDILRAALPIIGLLSLFVPALGTVALIMAISLVAIDSLQAATGRGSWQDAAVGALGLLAGGALGAAAKSLIGPGGQVLIPSVQGMTPALATGGSRAAAGTLTVALQVNSRNMVANTYWAASRANDAANNSRSFVESLSGPWQNLAERVDNTMTGRGPRTDEELYRRD